jgi:hypothetical protein
MDPLSITTATLTLLGAVSATSRILQTVLSLRNVRQELLQLYNEVCCPAKRLSRLGVGDPAEAPLNPATCVT